METFQFFQKLFHVINSKTKTIHSKSKDNTIAEISLIKTNTEILNKMNPNSAYIEK